MKLSASALGITCLIFGIAIFSVQDLILKWISGDYPLHQAMVLRSITAIPCLLVLTLWLDGGLRSLISPTWPAMLGRGLLNFAAYTAYYLALAALPMATTVALYFTAPLIITILSVVLLRETVSARRWVAVLVGFVGVVIMVRPGGDLFDWAALLPVFCGAAYAGSMILARTMGARDTAAAMAFWGNIAFLGCAAVLSVIYGPGGYGETGHASLQFLMRGWAMPTLWDGFLMGSCGVIAAVGLIALTHAYRISQSSVVAPFEFTFAFWGVLWGWLFWGDLPDLWGWVGIAVIVGAGILVLRAEPPVQRVAAPVRPGA